jgi:hypothetical protein
MSRFNNLKFLYKKSSEDEETKEEGIAKKLLRMPIEKLSIILEILLKENEDLRNNIYNSVYKSSDKLDDLA